MRQLRSGSSESYRGRIRVVPATKISITLDDEELAWLRRRAKRLHGGNLSAAILETARALRRNELLGQLLDDMAVPRPTPEEHAAVLAEWRGEPKARARRKRRS
jgi:hypothetical protein